jgi:hypothetical protein
MESIFLHLKENIEDKFVAFIDVMGFSNLVNKGNLSNLEGYFEKVIEVINGIKEDKDLFNPF